MFDKLNYIELSGELYPIKCDMIVLERIQDKYNDISEFENGITGFQPKIGEVIEKILGDPIVADRKLFFLLKIAFQDFQPFKHERIALFRPDHRRADG